MKRAFSLIELLVAVGIVLVLSAGAFVYINQGLQRQTLLKAAGQVVSGLKLANSLAKTRQMPHGSSGSLRVVESYFDSNKLYTKAISSVGMTSTFSQEVIGIPVTNSNRWFFYAGSGFLGKNATGTMYGAGETATIILSLNENQNMSVPIIIDAMGQVRQGEVIQN